MKMRWITLVVALCLANPLAARMYQWTDPETGTAYLSGDPPSWYRSKGGGPRVQVFEDGELVDDTEWRASKEREMALREQALKEQEERRLAEQKRKEEEARRKEEELAAKKRAALAAAKKQEADTTKEDKAEVTEAVFRALIADYVKQQVAGATAGAGEGEESGETAAAPVETTE